MLSYILLYSGGGHRGTTSRLPLQFFPASRLPVPFLPNLPPPTKSYNFAKNWPKMAEKWVKVIFQDHGVNENYLNMKFQAKLMQRSRENDQKPNFWKFAYKKFSDFSAEIGLRHFSTLITGRRHRMEPPIALVMGIPTSQTFFPSNPASHTCFLPTSRLLVIITLWPPASLLENSLSRPPTSQMNFKSPPAPSPDFGQYPASQIHCPPCVTDNWVSYVSRQHRDNCK